MATWCRDIEGGVELRVKVVPGASRDRIAGLLGDALKIQVSAAPERGKANSAVEELLASVLCAPRNAVRVTGGMTQPRKTVHVTGVRASDVIAALQL